MTENRCCNCGEHDGTYDCDCVDDELVFLQCPVCYKLVTVAEEPGRDNICVECCGKKMINLNELSTSDSYRCSKCGAELYIGDFSYLNGDHAEFVCCGQKMEPIDGVAENCDTYAFCPVCNVRVAVSKPESEVSDIECCGHNLILEIDNSDSIYECSKCGSKILIDIDSVCKDANSYKSPVCCGEFMKLVKKDVFEDEDFDIEESEVSYVCLNCRRTISLLRAAEHGESKIECCGKEMVCEGDAPVRYGELYICKKCGLKLIVEESCLCDLKGAPCSLVCCGEQMSLVE